MSLILKVHLNVTLHGMLLDVTCVCRGGAGLLFIQLGVYMCYLDAQFNNFD